MVEKPHIKVPEGFELRVNPVTGNWALYPVKDFSINYLKKNHFVPKRETNTESYEVVNNGKMNNSKLHKAKRAKNDEFYTRLDDIVSELKYYAEHFKGKRVYCPCDKCFNEGRSKFFDYCAINFKDLGLKELIATQYNPNGKASLIRITADTISELESRGIKWVWNGENGGTSAPDESEIPMVFLKGDGSFDSQECREIMRNCDIVVTNPPFSLFREFMAQIMEFGKKFLVMGNQNAITYKEIFPYIKENKMWLGYHNNVTYIFESPNGNTLESNRNYVSSKGFDPDEYIKVPAICWFTNLEHGKRKEPLYVWKEYTPEEYPTYDNYDAIEVPKVSDIPKDYNGIMGVPITFLDKYCPEQFEIVDAREIALNDRQRNKNTYLIKDADSAINGKPTYARIAIRFKK